jgi:serine/threonine protein kinase
VDRQLPHSTATFCSSSAEQGEHSGERERRTRAEGLLGTVLADRFELRRLLGMGSYGEVYQVHDRLSPSWPLAVKLLRHSSAHALYRFKREFRALAEVTHPNLAKLHELFLDGTSAFFTMELVDGVDFLSYVRPGGVLSPERLVRTLEGLCEGVLALHARGRLHRDLKPSNVLVDKSGHVVIVDFGLATLFEGHDAAGSEHGFAGTAQYAAPEQLALGKVGPESDCYAVGTMLYEALSGSLPWEGPFSRLVEEKSLPVRALPELPEELRALGEVCMELLRADAAERTELGAVRAQLGRASRPPPAQPKHRFLGRAQQLADLERIFQSVESGAAAVALVLAPSGLGKTTLVEEFLESLRSEHRALVLRGRCYVNEELPYRAVDGGIDALSHYLCSLPPTRTAALLPRDATSLASLFPVLSRVEAIASAPPIRSAPDDRASLRERAGAALRELLTRLSDRMPLVLFIDDIQWDDPDSAWLLSVILSEPESPALLLLATCRNDARAHSKILHALEGGGRPTRLVHEIELPPLTRQETLALALSACSDAHADLSTAERIAVESGGHPLFTLELARFLQGRDAQGSPELSLDAAIRGRSRDLSPAALRLLQIVCVAGHPLKYGVAAAAGACEAAALHELVTRKLVSSSGSAADATLEVYHDRVREALLPEMQREHVRALHAALADALASEREPRFDSIVEHYLAAGRAEQAARHALSAADQAAAVLAFHRVPALLTLAMNAAAAGERGALGVRLAESYALVGRAAEAARAYQEAAKTESDPAQRWELSCMAMWQALQAEQYDQGNALLRELDAPFGLRGVRPTQLRVLGSALRYLWSRIWGLPKLQARGARQTHPSDPQRLRLAFRASTGLIGHDAGHSAHLAVVTFGLAAKLGETGIYAAFLSMHAVSSSLRTGRRSARSERLLREAKTLAEAQSDVGARLLVASSQTTYHLCVGDYERAERELLALVDLPLPATPLGSYLRASIEDMQLSVLFWLGRLTRARVFAGRAIGAARERSNHQAELGLRAQAAFRLLADDDAETAWNEWSLASQHYPMFRTVRGVTAGVLIALYAGRTDRAERALAHAWRASLNWDVYVAPGRSLYVWWWGCVAAARLAAGETARGLRLRLTLAIWLLGTRPLPFFEPFAQCLRAQRAFLRGETARGVEYLERARAVLAQRGLRLMAASASCALAALHPDARLRQEHAAYAREVFEAEKVSHPEKWMRAFLPGLPAPRT